MIDHSICGALSEEMVDRILADSFPASDPPPWTMGRENRSSGCVDDSTGTMGTSGLTLKREDPDDYSAQAG